MTAIDGLTTAGVEGAVKTANGDVAVKAAASGYSGKDVTVYVAFDAEGAISGISIDGSTQTTGIGSKVSGDSFASGLSLDGGEVASGSLWTALPVQRIPATARSTPSTQPSTATTMRSRGCSNDERKPSKWKVFTAGIIRENPVLRLVLGCCSALAVTTTVSGAVGMGLAMTFVLVCSNIVISALRKVIPAKVHLPCYIVIIATFVTVVQMVLQAFVPDLYKALGVYLALIVVNCIILAVPRCSPARIPSWTLRWTVWAWASATS